MRLSRRCLIDSTEINVVELDDGDDADEESANPPKYQNRWRGHNMDETPIRDRMKERAHEKGYTLFEEIIDQSIDRAKRRRKWVKLGVEAGIIDGSVLKHATEAYFDKVIDEIERQSNGKNIDKQNEEEE